MVGCLECVAQSGINHIAGVRIMENWQGLSIPTYFLNFVVHRRAIGPCVQLFMGVRATEADQPLPEVSFIWPAPDMVRASADTLEFLRMSNPARIIDVKRRWLS